MQPDGKQYGITVTLHQITKAVAKELLSKTAPHQRKIKSWSKFKLVSDMNADNWWFTGTPIVLDSNGFLIDGQHRLEAFIESTKELEWFIVVYGVARNAYVAIDSGVGKSVGDYFKFEEIPNAIVAAATARWLFRYKKASNGALLHTSLITKTAIEECYIEHSEEIQSCIPEQRTLSGFIGSHSCVVALNIIISGAYGKDFANDFFNRLSSGVGIGPVTQLHKAIDRDNKLPRSHITPDDRFCSIIKAAKSAYMKDGTKLIKPTATSLLSLDWNRKTTN
jgi:hypothetical protein